MFKRQCLIFLAALLLQACAALNPVPPQTFGEQVAYATAGLIAGFETLADLRDRGAIGREQGQKIFDELEKVSVMIRISRDAAEIGEQAGAERRLADALQLLTALEAEMKRASQ